MMHHLVASERVSPGAGHKCGSGSEPVNTTAFFGSDRSVGPLVAVPSQEVVLVLKSVPVVA